MSELIRPVAISVLLAAVALIGAEASAKQDAGTKGSAAGQSQVERGKYIVESVALCEQCHTPRGENGTPDKARWLMGGPVQLRATYPARNWAAVAPRLAGQPPGNDADFIRLLTTGISRTGSAPNPPMPPFRMSRADAEAVLAYLKSLGR